MGDCVGHEVRKARKTHHCFWCGEDIEPGQKYERWCSIDGHDAFTLKMHPECARVSAGRQEIYPYEHQRGVA